ncbi:MAG: hypothetical protein J6K17_14470 [Oscillospiraceae bacterium]|nr:hypothetical protein [Oscillospiraceae bacterium]
MKKAIIYFIVFLSGIFISGLICQSLYSHAAEDKIKSATVSTIEEMTKDIINENNFFYYSDSPIFTNKEVNYEIYTYDNKYGVSFPDSELPTVCYIFEAYGSNLFYIGREKIDTDNLYASGSLFIDGVAIPDYSKYDNYCDTFDYKVMCESICENYCDFAEKKIEVYAVKSFEWDMSLNGGKRVVVSIDDSSYIDNYAVSGIKGYILDRTNYSQEIKNNTTYEKLISNSYEHVVKYIG